MLPHAVNNPDTYILKCGYTSSYILSVSVTTTVVLDMQTTVLYIYHYNIGACKIVELFI